MKPLEKDKLEAYLQRFDNFKDGEFRHIEVISPYVTRVTLAGQDSAREFNWITVTFEFIVVNGARLIDNSKLEYVDMSEGINIIFREDIYVFGLGNCYNIASAERSQIYILCTSLKYEEGSFRDDEG